MKEINDLLIREIFLKPTIFSVILVLGAIVLIVTLIRYKFKKKEVLLNGTPINNTYQKKNIMTETEYQFYLKLKPLELRYKIVPQLNLASIVRKTKNNYFYTDLFRNIDFAIFSSDYSEILLLIELNDTTHKLTKKKERDLKVQSICKEIEVPLIKFYTKYSNHQDYVIRRILSIIEKTKN